MPPHHVSCAFVAFAVLCCVSGALNDAVLNKYNQNDVRNLNHVVANEQNDATEQRNGNVLIGQSPFENRQNFAAALPQQNSFQKPAVVQDVQGVGQEQNAGPQPQGFGNRLPGEKVFKKLDSDLLKVDLPLKNNLAQPSNQQPLQNVENANKNKYQFKLAPDTRVWQVEDNNANAAQNSLQNRAAPINTQNMNQPVAKPDSNVNQLQYQNVNPPQHQMVNQPQEQNVNQPQDQNVNQRPDQNVNQPQAQNVNQRQDQNVNQPQDKSVEEPHHQSVNEPQPQNVNQPQDQNVNQDQHENQAQDQHVNQAQDQGYNQDQNVNAPANNNIPVQDQHEPHQQGVASQPKLEQGNFENDQNILPNKIPQLVDEYKKQGGDAFIDEDKINVLPTIDNHLVVQQSQEGIDHENNYNNKLTQKPLEQPRVSDDNTDDMKPGYKFNGAEKQIDKVVGYFAARRTTPPSTTSTTSAKPTPKSRPDASARKDVIWFPEYHSYSLRASVDNRFRIRYAPIPGEGTPWPMPQFYNSEKIVFYINPYNFVFNPSGETCDVLEYAIERVAKNMFGELPDSESERYSKKFLPPPGSQLRMVNVTVLKECDVFPYLDMDESYDLEVRQTGAAIIARQVWGALRGLETFSQLVYQDIKGQFVMNKTLIHDFPRFKHRGVMLDTARHYLNKETILLNLEAMAQNKMNVFHWHIVDEQSFPFVSNTYPNLTKNGAYDEKTHIYTHEVIMEIIEEARMRGIRVIPEFDTPGHTFAWGLGQDNLLTPCYDYHGKPDGYFGPINPILKSTYKFLDGLFREVFGLFKDKYVHLGGDEVSLDCWGTNPYLQRFMSRNQLFDVKDLLNVYTKKLVDIVEEIGENREQGSGYIVWQEVFDDGVKLKPDAIVQIWKGNAWDLDRVTSQGLRALFSSCWYLDYISYGQDWDKYYMCNQMLSDLDSYSVRNQSLIMGGDVCLWTEFADDASILPRIWPRASAAAERLWSAKTVADVHQAAPRIEEQRCRMKRRGIPTGVLSGPGYCRKYLKPGDNNSDKNVFFKFFDWKGQNEEETQHKASYNSKPANAFSRNVYIVDMNSMYVIPLLIIVCIVCLTLLAAIQDTGRSRILAILAMPVKTTSRRSFKTLLYVFMIFALVWCVWTAPIWMHAWENSKAHT